MNASYKIKINETQKSVTCEVVVEHDDKAQAIKETKEIYEDVTKFCRTKTLQKNI